MIRNKEWDGMWQIQQCLKATSNWIDNFRQSFVVGSKKVNKYALEYILEDDLSHFQPKVCHIGMEQ